MRNAVLIHNLTIAGSYYFHHVPLHFVSSCSVEIFIAEVCTSEVSLKTPGVLIFCKNISNNCISCKNSKKYPSPQFSTELSLRQQFNVVVFFTRTFLSDNYFSCNYREKIDQSLQFSTMLSLTKVALAILSIFFSLSQRDEVCCGLYFS